jgi:hypothetical protein
MSTRPPDAVRRLARLVAEARDTLGPGRPGQVVSRVSAQLRARPGLRRAIRVHAERLLIAMVNRSRGRADRADPPPTLIVTDGPPLGVVRAAVG